MREFNHIIQDKGCQNLGAKSDSQEFDRKLEAKRQDFLLS
jgi:hypothetical protein